MVGASGAPRSTRNSGKARATAHEVGSVRPKQKAYLKPSVVQKNAAPVGVRRRRRLASDELSLPVLQYQSSTWHADASQA